ncbi:MAG: ADOP family duplicated permease [bacterium]
MISSASPPMVAERILEWMLPGDMAEPYLGDLAESFAERWVVDGPAAARRWYWKQALHAPMRLTIRRGHRFRAERRSGDPVMIAIGTEARHALRGFARRPAFTAIAVLTTAIGIGAATTIFSAANPILFEPLPYPHADRVMSLLQLDDGKPGDRMGYMTIADIRDRSRTLALVAASGSWQGTMTGSGQPALYQGLRVSHQFFSVLGVHPAIGRDFLPSDDRPGAERTVILSNAVWRDRFNGDSSAIGHVTTINDYPYLVIGVMPEGFESVIQSDAQLWRPLQYDASLPYACRTCHHLKPIARLRDGVTVTAATQEVNGIFGQVKQEHAAEYPGRTGGAVTSLADDVTQAVRPAMFAVLGAVFLVLLIACVNVTNLLLGRTAERRSEIAVRSALGASQPRIVGQLLVESTLLAAMGGLLGVGLAWGGVRTLVRLAPASLPRVQAMHVNGPVLLVALLATTLVGLGFGMLPALAAARGSMQEGIQSGSRRTVGVSRSARSSLVVAEMALAVLVLAGSGLLLRSMRRLLDVSPGFESSGVLTMQVQVGGQRFANDTVTWRYFDEVLRTVRVTPGVQEAAFTSQLPLSSDFDASGIHSERHPRASPEDDPSAHRYAVTPGFLETMKIPVMRGRSLTAYDNGAAPPVVLVNDAFAKRFFPNEEAIGQRIRTGAADSGPWRTIVGITGDIHQLSLAGESTDAFYLPESQWSFADGSMSLVVRTSGDPAALREAVQTAVWSIDRNQPIVRVATMPEIVASSASQRRFVLTLFEAFALMGTLLAALGMYGVLAASVTERAREIGLREALGASPAQIMSMIVRQGMLLASAGAVLGVLLSTIVTRALADQLFGISRSDPVTYFAALGTLLLVALVACAAPAWRAARVDPMESLRAE